jgi:hypothetical protein
MDVFDAFRSGALQRDLTAAGVACGTPHGLVPESFLPAWLLKKPQAVQGAA